MSKTIVVFGAAGVLGKAVTKLLEVRGFRVIKIGHSEIDRRNLMKESPGEECRFADVGDYAQVKRVANRLRQAEIIPDGIIYVVGKYGKGGYAKRSGYSISTIPPKLIEEEITSQLFGLISVFQNMLFSLACGGTMIFVSSVANENFSHNIISYEGKELIIEHMRRDATVITRRIKIHHLGFGGIDTDYYHGKDTCLLHSIPFVTQEIVSALDFTAHLSCKKLIA